MKTLSRVARTLLACSFLACAAAWAAEAPPAPAAPPGGPAVPKAKAGEADHIVVQHVLIGFAGSVPGKNITRTKEEAAALAADVLARAQKGENFDALVKEYTADSAPGIYGMANTGVRPESAESARSGMVKGFGDASFALAVGDVGMASYDPKTSPYGWHIVKRIK